MLEREKSVSTFIGEGVAIPHGTDESRALVRRTTLGVLQFPDGVDWDGNTVTDLRRHRGEGRRARHRALRARADPDGPGTGGAAADLGERRGRVRAPRIDRKGPARHEGGAVLRPWRPAAGGRRRAVPRSGRGEDPGAPVLDVRHRREDLQPRPPPPGAAARDRARDRRRGGRGGRERDRLGGGRPRAGDRRGAVRHVRRLRARPDAGVPEPDVGRLPLRRRVRRVPGRAARGARGRRAEPDPRRRRLRGGVGGRAAGVRAQRAGAGRGRCRRRRGRGRRGPDRLPARAAGAGPRRPPGVPGRAEPGPAGHVGGRGRPGRGDLRGRGGRPELSTR